MLYPGVKKLAKKFDFYRCTSITGGYVKNSIVYMYDGNNKKNVLVIVPAVDENDKHKILELLKINKIKKSTFVTEKELMIEFPEYLRPYSMKKIEKIVIEITDLIAAKYPHKKAMCSNCQETTEPQFYEIRDENLALKYGSLTHLCRNCYLQAESELNMAREAFRSAPDNYGWGILGAFLFSFLGIVITALLAFISPNLCILSMLVCLFLAQKGYAVFKGKTNRIFVVITILIAIFTTYIGLCAGQAGLVLYKTGDAANIIPALTRTETVRLIKVELALAGFWGLLYLAGEIPGLLKTNRFPPIREAGKIA